MTPVILYISLVLILILFLIQSMFLRRRSHQFNKLIQRLHDVEKQAGLGRLITGVAHDLSTPLGALGCALQTRAQAYGKLRKILESEGGVESDSAGMKKVFKAFDDTQDVVDESLRSAMSILDHLRKAGRGEPEGPVVLPVSEVIDGVLLILNNWLKNETTVIKELEPNILVNVKPGELGRVFANLITNALDAMAGKGTLTIKSIRQDDTVCISIGDSGPGLPAQKMESIFCSGWTTKGCNKGSGMGLFISREIIESFGGLITAENGPNGGAEFSVCLPVVSGVAQ